MEYGVQEKELFKRKKKKETGVDYRKPSILKIPTGLKRLDEQLGSAGLYVIDKITVNKVTIISPDYL